MIRFDQVYKRYPTGREALSGVSMQIGRGEMAFLTGPSGAGKSSILKLIALIERPSRGQVIVGDRNTNGIKPRAIPQFRRDIGVVFQDHKLLHDRPVADNVALPLIIQGVPRREIDKRVRAALDQVGLLGKENSRPLELSTGEQQRVGIARAVVAKPPLLIADEPTGNLDPDLALDIMRLFRRFNEVGVTVVIATHDLHLIDQFGARRIVLGDGRVKADASETGAAVAGGAGDNTGSGAVNAGAYFARHAQTLIGSLGRIAAQPVGALMTMSVIAIAIALPLCLHVFLQNVRDLSGGWNSAYDMSVYLDKSANLVRAQAIAKELQSRGDVASVKVVPAAQALAEFKDYSGFGPALDALTDNPLPNTLIVTPAVGASTPSGTAALKAAITALAGVAAVQIDTDWVQRLDAIVALLRRGVLLAGLLLGIGVMLIVGNTIRLDILNRRAEIEVTKLVGGSDGFVRRPFLYSGCWYGLGGGVLALLLVSVAVMLVTGPAARLAALYGSQFQLRGLDAATALLVVGAAGLLGWAGSWLAASQHIRAINPS